MLAPLFQSRVRVIQDVLPTAHEPLLVLTEEYESYYLKYHKASYNAHEMQAEWLCAALLREWGIPTPDVAVLTIGEAVISNLPSNAKRAASYLKKPCFGSKAILGAQDSVELLNGQIELEKLSNAEDLVWLALYDAWIANDDRRASHHNTLLAPDDSGKKYIIWAIDHAYAFSRIDLCYLDPQYLYCDFKKNLISATATKAHLRRWRQHQPLWIEEELRSGFYLRVENCQKRFLDICEWLPPSYKLSERSQTALFNFLFSESRQELLLSRFFECLP
ncbi:HipA family kinase [Hymenobacter perfusus]|uniref:HipA-like kinase domain-containing protein n=1 Tax=Hymenobacter perfusus TaxID=1236770 RepID=A0A3R9MN42_9BACT|nr:HipA family kinase [Hymenobacter perfusus]RSK46099.1 hypothetical protein EI293_02710 [Hymenobacter perfusus]